MTIYLISFPRSGNSWFRYCIETLLDIKTVDINPDYNNKSLYKTIGINKIFNADIEIVKSHKFIAEKYDTVIFILRDFKDAVSSHKQRGAKGTTKDNLLIYMNLLNEYHRFSGAKILIHYENLTHSQSLINSINDVSKFLNVNLNDIEEFKTNYKKHKEISQNGYKSKIGGCRNNITTKVDFTNSMKTKYKEIIEKYLKRYL